MYILKGGTKYKTVSRSKKRKTVKSKTQINKKSEKKKRSEFIVNVVGNNSSSSEYSIPSIFINSNSSENESSDIKVPENLIVNGLVKTMGKILHIPTPDINKCVNSQQYLKEDISFTKKYNESDKDLPELFKKYSSYAKHGVSKMLQYNSGRTSDILKLLKSKKLPKRVFYVFSHGVAEPTLHTVPDNNFILQSGKLCYATHGGQQSDQAYFNILSNWKALYYIFGLQGPKGPKGSIYNFFNAYFPNELCMVKSLTYSKEEALKTDMLFGIYENKQDGMPIDRYRHNTLVNNKNETVEVDSLFTKSGGVYSSTIIEYIQNTFNSSVNFIFFVSCSIIAKTEKISSYGKMALIYNPPTFYSNNATIATKRILRTSRKVDKNIFISKPQLKKLESNFDFKFEKELYDLEKEFYERSDIPYVRPLFIFDRFTRCVHYINNISTLWLLYSQELEDDTGRYYVGYIIISKNNDNSQNSVSIQYSTKLVEDFIRIILPIY